MKQSRGANMLEGTQVDNSDFELIMGQPVIANRVISFLPYSEARKLKNLSWTMYKNANDNSDLPLLTFKEMQIIMNSIDSERYKVKTALFENKTIPHDYDSYIKMYPHETSPDKVMIAFVASRGRYEGDGEEITFVPQHPTFKIEVSLEKILELYATNSSMKKMFTKSLTESNSKLANEDYECFERLLNDFKGHVSQKLRAHVYSIMLSNVQYVDFTSQRLNNWTRSRHKSVFMGALSILSNKQVKKVLSSQSFSSLAKLADSWARFAQTTTGNVVSQEDFQRIAHAITEELNVKKAAPSKPLAIKP